MKLLLIFSIVAIAMVAVFALYFSFVPQLFPFTKTLGEFSAMFRDSQRSFKILRSRRRKSSVSLFGYRRPA
jgi:hypothetical protein